MLLLPKLRRRVLSLQKLHENESFLHRVVDPGGAPLPKAKLKTRLKAIMKGGLYLVVIGRREVTTAAAQLHFF